MEENNSNNSGRENEGKKWKGKTGRIGIGASGRDVGGGRLCEIDTVTARAQGSGASGHGGLFGETGDMSLMIIYAVMDFM